MNISLWWVRPGLPLREIWGSSLVVHTLMQWQLLQCKAMALFTQMKNWGLKPLLPTCMLAAAAGAGGGLG